MANVSHLTPIKKNKKAKNKSSENVMIPIFNEFSEVRFNENEDKYNSIDLNETKFSTQSQFAYEKLRFLFDNFKTLSEQKTISLTFNEEEINFSGFDIKEKLNSESNTYHRDIKNTVTNIDALTKFNTEIAKEFGPECIFIEYDHQLTIDEKEEGFIYKHVFNFEIVLESLANFLFKKEFHQYAILSRDQASTSIPFYFYDTKNCSWSMVSEKSLKQNIYKQVAFILRQFSTKKLTSSIETVVKHIINIFPEKDDKGNNLLDNFTSYNPSLVQFDDLVYDISSDKFTKMNHELMLVNKHNYRIPTGYDNVDDISYEDGWLSVQLSDEDLRNKCKTFIERFEILHPKEDLEFIFSVLGYLFYHHGEKWQVLPMIIGGGGLGKSHLYGYIIGQRMLGNQNMSSITQENIDKGSDFLKASFYQKELNLISETNGSFLSESLITALKSVNGDPTEINQKFRNTFNVSLYSTFVMLGNEEQLPAIPTNYANDPGLKRRIVILKCNDTKKKREFEADKGQKMYQYFTDDKFEKELPFFALLCMRTFKKHEEDIHLFQDNDVLGATKKQIEGFTTESMVSDTSAYFKNHDRNREFILFLEKRFVSENQYNDKNKENFINWLKRKPSTEITKLFVDWFREYYPHMTAYQNQFRDYLKKVHDISPTTGRVMIGNKLTPRKTFGEPFAKLAYNIIKESYNDEKEMFGDEIIEDDDLY